MSITHGVESGKLKYRYKDDDDNDACSTSLEFPQDIRMKPINMDENNDHIEHNSVRKIRDKCGPKSLQKYAGLALTLISSFSFALNSLANKVLLERYDVFLVALVRALGVIFPSAVLMIHARYVQKDPIFDPITWSDKKTLAAVLGRGLCGAVVTIGVTVAIKLVGVGDTLVLKSCSPLFVAFFAACLLNERLGPILVICGIQVILGVFCIAQPPFMTGKQSYDVNNVFGILAGLSVAVTAALGIICIRYARKLHFSIPAFSLGVVSSLIAGGVCGATGGFAVPANGTDALLFLAVATCTAVTQISMVLAVRYDTAGTTALVRTSEVFFGFFLQITCLGIIPDSLSAVGAIIVVLAVLIAVSSKK